MKYLLPDNAYKAVKWLDLVAMPALTTLYVALAAVWGWPYADQVAQTSAAVCTCLGVLVGISAATARPDDRGDGNAE
jgi:hypothetical protein